MARRPMPAQYYSKSKHGGNVFMELHILESSIEREQLRIYNSVDKFRTEEKGMALSVPAKEYKIQLKTGERLLCEWILQGISHNKPYMAFDYKVECLLKVKNYLERLFV